MKKVSVLFFYFFVSSFLGYAQDEQKVVVLSEQGNKTWNEFKDMINKRTKVYQSSEDEGMKAYFLVDPLKNSKEESAEQVYKIILWYRSMDNLSKIFELIDKDLNKVKKLFPELSKEELAVLKLELTGGFSVYEDEVAKNDEIRKTLKKKLKDIENKK